MSYRTDQAWIDARDQYVTEIVGEAPQAALLRRNRAAHRMFRIESDHQGRA